MYIATGRRSSDEIIGLVISSTKQSSVFFASRLSNCQQDARFWKFSFSSSSKFARYLGAFQRPSDPVGGSANGMPSKDLMKFRKS